MPKAIALYLASADDLATTNYFLLLQITKLPPTYVKYPEVDRLSSSDPAQSVLVNFFTWKVLYRENNKP